MPSVVCLFWLWVHICLLLLSFFGFLWLSRMWDPNPLTKDWTRAPCSGSMELKPLDHWGVPHLCFFSFPFMFQMWWICFILLWCKTKDVTTTQRPIYYKVMKKWCGTCRTWWTTGWSGRLLWTWHTIAEEHIEKKRCGTELKCGTNVTTSGHAFKHLP